MTAQTIGANFKLTASVVGQQAIDKLRESTGGIGEHIGKLPGLAKVAGLALVGLGAGLSLGTIKEQFDGMVQSMLDVKDAAERVGTSVDNMSALATVAKIAGEDLGMVEAGITKLNKALAGSDDEAAGAAHALDAIGLSIKELRKLDPTEAFKQVALALAEFEGNGAKSALVMDLFGKSGAQLLPFLNDYAELADTVGKVTTEQAEAADQYEKATRRLQAAQKDLYKVFTVEMLPVATDFVQALLDVGVQTNGVKDSAKGLAADGSLKVFFQEAARAAAAFLDVASMVLRGLAQIKDSIAVVLNDLSTGVKVAGLGLGAGFTEEGRAAIKQVLAEREAYVTEANKRLQDRLDAGMTPFTDALNLRLQAREGGGRGSAEFAANDPRRFDLAPKKDLTGYTSRAPKAPTASGGGGADPYASELQGLGRESAKLLWQTQHIEQFAEKITSAKEAQVQFDIEQGKFANLSKAQKDALMEAARAVDRNAEALRQAQVGLEFDKQTRAIDSNTASLGLNTRERELAAASQELENKGIKKGTELYEQLMQRRREALERKDAAEQNPLLGLQMGIAQLGEQVGGQAKLMQDALVGAFNGAADALAQFVMTGKADFKELARSILADLSKMIIRQQLFNALKAASGFFGFASGGAFGGDGQGDGVQAFASGGAFTNNIYSSPTMFRFADGGAMRLGLMAEAGAEAVMPLSGGGVQLLDASGQALGKAPVARGPGGRLSVVVPKMHADGDAFGGQIVAPRGASGAGSSAGASISVSVPVTIQSGQQDKPTADATAAAGDLSKMMEAKVKEVLAKEAAPGRLVWRIVNQQRAA